MVERRSPKPKVGGSSPSWPAIYRAVIDVLWQVASQSLLLWLIVIAIVVVTAVVVGTIAASILRIEKSIMSTSVDSPEYKLDGLKWLVVFAIIAAGTFGNAYYSEDFALLYRVLAMVALGAVAAFVALQTAKGAAFWALLKSAQVEMRKVVWPTKPETNQTTLMVLVVVFITAIILWGLDAILGKVASLIIG